VTTRSSPEVVQERVALVLEPVLGPVDIVDLQRLSGGASRETWALRAGDRDLILRRDPPGRPGAAGSMRLEADAMRACHRAGLRVPQVLVDDDGSTLGTEGLIMGRVAGETLPRRILRDDRFASARTRLVGQIGEFLAGLHAIDPAEVPGIAAIDPLAQYWDSYQAVEDRSPVFEKAYEWLQTGRPEPAATIVVHGDLRLGNVIVDDDGLAAVIDWELLHLGDPLEDLAWVCVKAWRFGAPLEVGGLGTIDELVAAYERAGGRPVDRDGLHWWLVEKTLQWGLGCMGQAHVHLSGAVRSHELAAIGRRAAEQEWDLVELLAPDDWARARAEPAPDPLPDPAGLYGRPTARELLAAVREFLADDVVPGTTGHLSYQARVAANVVATVERELASGPADVPTEPDGALPGWDVLARSTRAKLAVANPKHLAR
jgi:aminoglycoside phosphotransferase (APT) family kinase protein